MRVHITTLGCRLNQSESDRLARDFAAVGHEVVPDAGAADLHIVNTCGVTHLATRKSRHAARDEHRAAPSYSGARTVITGCASEIEPDYFAGVDGVALVTGHADKEHLIPLLIARGLLPEPDATVSEAFPIPHARTRAFVKIQDGCNNHCSYCVSRLARGAERSRPVADIIAEVQMLLREGFKEVVLTGLHAAAYGRDLDTNLPALLRALLAQTDAPRIRLSSLEPWGASDELLDLWSDARLCRHLHLPLQSGCDRTLRRMRRGYNTRQFAARVASARRRVPDIAISTDMIVGYPGESDEDFAASLAFVQQMQLSQAHVFTFSPRAGTEAALLADQVAPRIRQARSEAMKQVTDLSARRFREALRGRSYQVLWEEKTESLWSGLTDNYVRVFCASGRDLRNQIAPARIGELHPEGVRGDLYDD